MINTAEIKKRLNEAKELYTKEREENIDKIEKFFKSLLGPEIKIDAPAYDRVVHITPVVETEQLTAWFTISYTDEEYPRLTIKGDNTNLSTEHCLYSDILYKKLLYMGICWQEKEKVVDLMKSISFTAQRSARAIEEELNEAERKNSEEAKAQDTDKVLSTVVRGYSFAEMLGDTLYTYIVDKVAKNYIQLTCSYKIKKPGIDDEVVLRIINGRVKPVVLAERLIDINYNRHLYKPFAALLENCVVIQ